MIEDYDEFVDAEGILNVSEQDKSTGKPNHIMIEHENEVKKTEKFAIPQLEMVQGLKIKVSSPPERCCTPTNLVEPTVRSPPERCCAADHSFGEIPAPTSYGWGGGVLAAFSRR